MPRLFVCPSCDSRISLTAEEAALLDVSNGQATPSQIAHFELLDMLGEGAFGTVWKARDTELDRIVAIKIPRSGQVDRSARSIFLKEARAAAGLRHPHIVSVHEVGVEAGTVYIVSDFIDGLPLHHWLRQEQPADSEKIELCILVAESLHHGTSMVSYIGT